MTGPRLPIFILLLLASVPLCAQADLSDYSYLLRLEHETFRDHSCVLLQQNGSFHLETYGGESTRVAEGKIDSGSLARVKSLLNDLAEISQQQIDEPLIRNRDRLAINIFRHRDWQTLIFNSSQSQQPYRKSLVPLERWLDDLHNFPHKELSEDAGKTNCLVPRKIVLRKRSDQSSAQASTQESNATRSTVPAPLPQTSASAVAAAPPTAILRVLQMNMKSGVAEQRCTLVVGNGAYRTEKRIQKTNSKRVETKIDGGLLTPPELAELQKIIDDPALAEIRHRKTSRLVLPMSGEMLELEINRAAGAQDIVLSSTFNRRDVPFFYSGDGDIAQAQPLLTFLAEHVQNNGPGILDPQLRNDCTDAP